MRKELDSNELEMISGGQISFTYDGSAGSIWITAKNPKYFSFENNGVPGLAQTLHNKGYSDQEIIDYMLEKKYIW